MVEKVLVSCFNRFRNVGLCVHVLGYKAVQVRNCVRMVLAMVVSHTNNYILVTIQFICISNRVLSRFGFVSLNSALLYLVCKLVYNVTRES